MDTKPGWKTSEFYLTLLVIVIASLPATGLIDPGSKAMQVVALVGMVLAKLGYTASRAMVKSNATPAIVSELVQGTVLETDPKPTPAPTPTPAAQSPQ